LTPFCAAAKDDPWEPSTLQRNPRPPGSGKLGGLGSCGFFYLFQKVMDETISYREI
jgi:hypothetical protein